MNDNRLLDQCGNLLTRVGVLESAQTPFLSHTQLATYKRLIGESVARMFENNLGAAEDALTTAEQWIRGRGQEAARFASLKGATLAVALFGILVAVASKWIPTLSPGQQLAVLGASLGVVGAWLSVLQRTGGEKLDVGAGTRLFVIEGLVRVAIGGVGGFFVSLLLISK